MAEPPDVPEVVIERLPQYLRALAHLESNGIDVISSQQLGELLQVTPAQIRKDLSYFGRFGKQGRGYSISHLLERLRHILGLDQDWRVAIVGVGRLGRSIISYPGFAPEGFRVVCAFDSDQRLVGEMAGGLIINDFSDFKECRGAKRGADRHCGRSCVGGAGGHRPARRGRHQGHTQLCAQVGPHAAGRTHQERRPSGRAPVDDVLPQLAGIAVVPHNGATS